MGRESCAESAPVMVRGQSTAVKTACSVDHRKILRLRAQNDTLSVQCVKGLRLDVDKSFVVRKYQSHHPTETRLGEGGNRARIDPMFVERIRAELQLDTGPGQLPQLRRQIV